MNKNLLYKASHFHAAIQSGWHVTVYQQDKLLDHGGVIESQTLDSVKIRDSHYLKANCQFVINDSHENEPVSGSDKKFEKIAVIENEMLIPLIDENN